MTVEPHSFVNVAPPRSTPTVPSPPKPKPVPDPLPEPSPEPPPEPPPPAFPEPAPPQPTPEPEPGLIDPPLYAIAAMPRAGTPLTEEELVAILEQDDKLELKFDSSWPEAAATEGNEHAGFHPKGTGEHRRR